MTTEYFTEIYMAGKMQRLAWLIKRYSILSDDRIKCPRCNEKIPSKELLQHYKIHWTRY